MSDPRATLIPEEDAMNRSDEIRALGGLTGDALAETVRVVEDVHRAVSVRVDAALPAAAKPIHAIVRASTTATYATVRAAHRWIPRGAAAVTAARTPADSPSMLQSPAAAKAVASVNGIWGAAVTDRLAATTTVGLFRHGEALPIDADPEITDPRPNLVVFIHGLAETEADWNRQPRGASDRRIPYPELLETETDVTSLVVRYSTGAAIGVNGAELAETLERVTSAWPVPVLNITLIGHSMGGLVARSAAHQAQEADQLWVTRLRLIVTLGTPHLGAPLAKAVDHTERALNALPESAPIGRLLAPRSAGVRDLSHGRILVDAPATPDPPHVPGVTHCSLGSTLTQDPNHPVAMLIGDGLVRLPSASGRGRTRKLNFHVDTHLGRMHHLATLNDPSVYELIRGWVREFALVRPDGSVGEV
jgi:pimeloyl-ACP methyl ester carboxylesterase